jgi:predicted NBD/HSP70 family sugar kinase
MTARPASPPTRLRVSTKAGRGVTKQTNRRLVLQNLFDRQPVSRADLARATKLTPATVSTIVSELQNEGLIVEGEADPDESRVGKPPVMLSVAANARSILAFDLSSEQPSAAVLDLGGNIVSIKQAERAQLTGRPFLEAVLRFVETTVAETENDVLGIGIGTPGLIDGWRTIVQASAFDWRDVPLAELIEARVDHPTYLCNDADAAALAEFSQRPSDNGDLAVIMIGTGVGAGFILNGQPFTGSNSSAGEIGHLVVDPGGPRCRCGNRGCVETYAGLPAFQNVLDHGLDQADPGKLEALRKRAGHHLGIALAAVVASIGVENFYVAGPIELLGSDFCTYVAETVRRRCLATSTESLRVEFTGLGDNIVLRGAGSLVVSRQLGVA